MFVVQFFQLWQVGFEVGYWFVLGWCDLGLWQCVIIGGFVEIFFVVVFGELDVWCDVFELGGVVVDVEEFGDGYFQFVYLWFFVVVLCEVVQVYQVLYGVFVEGWFVDDQVVVVILDCCGEDF